ncbi:MAG: hypothetical protein NTX97_06020 [Bacteroidetes bacterium]|nr:hypothetical protein [Bacteroidota bacterium]
MNSCREFREEQRNFREGNNLRSLPEDFAGALRLFILFFLLVQNAHSQTNTGNQQYALNDPRNPDCPCHKYQKLADDAYKQTQDGNKQQFALNVNVTDQLDNKFNPKENILNQENIVGNDNLSYQGKRDLISAKKFSPASSGSSGAKIKKKSSGLWFRKKINRAKLKNSRIRKVHPNYSVCYKW